MSKVEAVREIVEKTAVYHKALNKCPVPVARDFINELVNRIADALYRDGCECQKPSGCEHLRLVCERPDPQNCTYGPSDEAETSHYTPAEQDSNKCAGCKHYDKDYDCPGYADRRCYATKAEQDT